MFTLFIGLVCIWLWDKLPIKALSIFIIGILCVLAEFINTDYGYWGVLLIFVLYLCRNSKIAIAISYISMVLLKYLPYLIKYNFYNVYIFLFIGTILAVVPILLYNGKQGKKIKYFLYIFYPVHLLCLYGIHLILS